MDIERLHAILSLKQLGLPLSRIAELLQTGTADTAALLSVQERVLRQVRLETDHALKLIAIARARLTENESLSAGELATLVRRVSRTVIQWTPELDDLAERIYTPEQLDKVRNAGRDLEETARLSAEWESIIAELDSLPDGCSPKSEAALALGRRMLAVFRRHTAGDTALWNSNARFWQEAVTDTRIAPQLQMKASRYEFFGEVLAELNRRGELKP